jgi:hypothetical protein
MTRIFGLSVFAIFLLLFADFVDVEVFSELLSSRARTAFVFPFDLAAFFFLATRFAMKFSS